MYTVSRYRVSHLDALLGQPVKRLHRPNESRIRLLCTVLGVAIQVRDDVAGGAAQLRRRRLAQRGPAGQLQNSRSRGTIVFTIIGIIIII
jgi:hypothetical protein